METRVASEAGIAAAQRGCDAAGDWVQVIRLQKRQIDRQRHPVAVGGVAMGIENGFTVRHRLGQAVCVCGNAINVAFTR